MSRRYCLSCGFEDAALRIGVCPRCQGIVAQVDAPSGTAPGAAPLVAHRSNFPRMLVLLSILAMIVGCVIVIVALTVVRSREEIVTIEPALLARELSAADQHSRDLATRQLRTLLDETATRSLQTQFCPLVPEILTASVHADPKSSVVAMELLDRLGAAAAKGLVIGLAASDGLMLGRAAFIRKEAARRLLALGEDARPALSELLALYAGTHDPAVRSDALPVLAGLLRVAPETLVMKGNLDFREALTSWESGVNSRAAALLEAVGEKNAADLLNGPPDASVVHGLLRAYGPEKRGSTVAERLLTSMGIVAERGVTEALPLGDPVLLKCAMRWLDAHSSLDPSTRTRIFEILDREDGAVQPTVMRLLTRGDMSSDERARPAIMKGLVSAVPGVPAAAVAALSAVPPEDDAVPVLISAFAAGQTVSRRGLAAVLRQFDAAFIDRLDSGISWRSDPKHPGLYRATQTPAINPQVVTISAWMVQPHVEILQSLRSDPDPEVAACAQQLLTWIGAISPAALFQGWRGTDARMQIACAGGFYRLGKQNPEALDGLMKGLQHPDPGVREAAIWALGRAGRDALPLLQAALPDEGALAALGCMPASLSTEVLPLLTQAAGHADPRVRMAARKSIRHLGLCRATLRLQVVELAIPALGDPDAGMRLEAIQTISAIKIAALAAPIRPAIKTSQQNPADEFEDPARAALATLEARAHVESDPQVASALSELLKLVKSK